MENKHSKLESRETTVQPKILAITTSNIRLEGTSQGINFMEHMVELLISNVHKSEEINSKRSESSSKKTNFRL